MNTYEPYFASVLLFLLGCSPNAQVKDNTVDASETDIQPSTDSNATPDSGNHTDADIDADTDSDIDSDTDSDSDTDINSDTDNDGDSDTDSDIRESCSFVCQNHCFSLGGRVISNETCPNPNQKCCDMSSTDGDTDTDIDSDTDTDTDVDTNFDTNNNMATDTNIDTNPNSDPHTDTLNSDGITVDGRNVLIDGHPFVMKGVCWNPIPKGADHPSGLDFAGLGAIDIPLMQAAGINAVRTYEPITDLSVLDALYAAGIYLLNTVYPWGGAEAETAASHVNGTKDHPAILMWVIGNEWNYNGLYVDLPFEESISRINEVAEIIRTNDTSHPIATVYGELPSAETVNSMPLIDIWGINAYRGIGFGDLFSNWEALSIPEKPMFMAEFGADAFNADLPGYDPDSQEIATTSLIEEIMNHRTTIGGVILGGTIFEWADEWWKAGNVDIHDDGGMAPGGGPYPDQTFNEEWWGIVDIDRTPRPAYTALKAIYSQIE